MSNIMEFCTTIINNLNHDKISEDIIPRYYLNVNPTTVGILDCTDFCYETFDLDDKYIIDFICNNPSEFMNLNCNAEKSLYLIKKDFLCNFRYGEGTVKYEEDKIIIDDGYEVSTIYIIKELNDYYNILHKAIILDFYSDALYLFVKFDINNSRDGIDLYISSILKESGIVNSTKFLTFSKMGYVYSQYIRRVYTEVDMFYSVRLNTIETYIDSTGDKNILLKYYKYIVNVEESRLGYYLDDLRKLSKSYPDIITDIMIAELVRKKFLG